MRDRVTAATPPVQAEGMVLPSAVLQVAQAISDGICRVSTSRLDGSAAAAPDRPQLVDVAEAARLLGVSRTTVTRLCDQGRMPCVVVCRGRRQQLRRIPRAFIDAVASHAVRAGGHVGLQEFAAEWPSRNGPSGGVPPNRYHAG